MTPVESNISGVDLIDFCSMIVVSALAAQLTPAVTVSANIANAAAVFPNLDILANLSSGPLNNETAYLEEEFRNFVLAKLVSSVK
jgi:hypothetical protein